MQDGKSALRRHVSSSASWILESCLVTILFSEAMVSPAGMAQRKEMRADERRDERSEVRGRIQKRVKLRLGVGTSEFDSTRERRHVVKRPPRGVHACI